jgi:hypothetical protein
MLQELIAQVGVKVNGLYLAIDLMDFCPYNCQSCSVSVFGKHGTTRMSIDTFRKLLDHLPKLRICQLYSYSDPTFVPDLHLFIQELRDRNVPSCISTTLQGWACDWEKVIEARPNEIRFSYTGPRMSHYQKGCDSKRFLKNLGYVQSLPRHKETRWTMFWHRYRTNEEDMWDAERLCQVYHIDFLPYPAIFLVNERIVEKTYTPEDLEIISEMWETPEANIARIKKRDNFCTLQSKQLYVGANLDVYLCQIIYQRRFVVGHATEDLSVLRKRIKSHEFCLKCKAVGGHKYCEIYESPSYVKEAVKENDKGKYA